MQLSVRIRFVDSRSLVPFEAERVPFGQLYEFLFRVAQRTSDLFGNEQVLHLEATTARLAGSPGPSITHITEIWIGRTSREVLPEAKLCSYFWQYPALDQIDEKQRDELVGELSTNLNIGLSRWMPEMKR